MEIGAQAREALNGQRRHVLEEQQHFVHVGGRDNEFMKKQTTSVRHPFPMDLFRKQSKQIERVTQGRDAPHELTVQIARVAEQREILKILLTNGSV